MQVPTLGIDISKKTFDVALVRDPESRKHKQHKFSHTPAGFTALQSWLVKQAVVQVHGVLEATGAYGDAVASFLAQAGYIVSIVNPSQIKAFGKSELQRHKTDRADAVLIARFAWQHHPAPWTPPTPVQQELQALVRHLDDLLKQCIQITNRLSEGRVTAAVRHSWTQVVATLNEPIATTKQQIKDHFTFSSTRHSNNSSTG